MNKFLLLIFLFIGFCGFSQKDSITLKNNDVLVGEVKTLLNGVLTMKTSYSDKDFKIEYKEVTEIYLNQTFLILLTNGGHYLGTAKTTKPEIIKIKDNNGLTFETNIESLSQLKESGEKFWSRFKGNIDLGFNLTKANNAVQFNVNSNLNYVGKKWNFNASYSNTINDQDIVDKTKRVEWDLDAQRFLFKDYFGIAQVSFLSNTEQELKGRTTGLLDLGKYLVNSHRLYLGIMTGFNYNNETYFDSTLDKNSGEINLGVNFNMFEFGDFNMNTDIIGYYGLTEQGRFRFDYSITLKYDMPWDFYIKFDFSLNYDNQPAAIGNEFDYVFNSGFGWELK